MVGAAKFEEYHYVSAPLRGNAEARAGGAAEAGAGLFRTGAD